MTQAIDVTGLSPTQVRAVQHVVDAFRGQPAAPPAPSHGPPPGETAEEWVARLRAFAASRPRSDTLADDSRESIYRDDGR